MKNRLNVLALTALACSFSALALTSCNNGGRKGDLVNVSFCLNGGMLRNEKFDPDEDILKGNLFIPTIIEAPNTVKRGSKLSDVATNPKTTALINNMVRKTYVYNGDKMIPTNMIFKGWSEDPEIAIKNGKPQEEAKLEDTVIDNETDLEPIYYNPETKKQNDAPVYCVSFELPEGFEWSDQFKKNDLVWFSNDADFTDGFCADTYVAISDEKLTQSLLYDMVQSFNTKKEFIVKNVGGLDNPTEWLVNGELKSVEELESLEINGNTELQPIFNE